MVVTVIGWYWDGVDNLGQMTHQHVLREAAHGRRVELRFTDDPLLVNGPAAMLEAQSVPAMWEAEEASRSVGAVLAAVAP